jgi:hypothetical protein
MLAKLQDVAGAGADHVVGSELAAQRRCSAVKSSRPPRHTATSSPFISGYRPDAPPAREFVLTTCL